MEQTEFEQNVKAAMAFFLSFAALIFFTAFTYTFITGNVFAEVIMLSAGVIITGVIFYIHKKINR